MTYTLTLHVPDDTPPGQRQAAERRFRDVLETALGDAALVAPVYRAYLNIVGQHGESPDTEALTLDERLVLETWQQAETAAVQAVFGPHRHLDEGGYQIGLPA